MRTKNIVRWRKAALCGALSLALSTQAQETAPKNETQPVVTEQSPRPPPDGNIKPVPGAPDEYTIQKGDTLWDLSQKFLNNPWYWPKIWSLNPAIENPHWIYPGNHLRIVPGEGGAAAPAQVQAPADQQPNTQQASAEGQVQAPAGEPQAAEPEQQSQGAAVAPAPTGSPDLEVVNRNSRESLASSSAVSVSGKLAFTPPPVVTVRSSGMVTPEELANAGSLAASFEERELLSIYDTAYVTFKGDVPARVGDKVIIFRPDGDVVQPVTHQKLASQTKTVGTAKVIAVNGQLATVQIERTWEEISRGDLVRPWVSQDQRVAPKPNTADVKGIIVSAVQGDLTTFGEAHEVFIDKGSADGVQVGNTFAVVRKGDGLSNELLAGTASRTAGEGGDAANRVKVPDENVGLLLVVDSREHLSTAIVIKSIRELEMGDHVEMHATGAGGGQ